MNIHLIANTSGFFSLLAVVIAVSPIFINLLRSPFKLKRSILQIAHLGLMFAICLGLIHGLLMTQLENIDFYDITTYWIYAVGLFAFNLLILIAFMFAELKSNLKKFNYLSYGLLLLIACHIGQQIAF